VPVCALVGSLAHASLRPRRSNDIGLKGTTRP